MQAQTVTPAIFVSVLADYNAGRSHGAWIPCDQGEDTALDAIRNLMATSPTLRQEGRESGEWAIHDAEGFDGVWIGEHAQIDELCALAEAIEEHGPVFAAFYDYAASGSTVADCLEQFQEAYQGTFDTLEAWAEEWAEETGLLDQVPEPLRYYFDFERYARDCEINGDIFSVRVDGGLAVFTHY